VFLLTLFGIPVGALVYVIRRALLQSPAATPWATITSALFALLFAALAVELVVFACTHSLLRYAISPLALLAVGATVVGYIIGMMKWDKS
jgi:hypothetical protein